LPFAVIRNALYHMESLIDKLGDRRAKSSLAALKPQRTKKTQTRKVWVITLYLGQGTANVPKHPSQRNQKIPYRTRF
jgi:hypothetical protein